MNDNLFMDSPGAAPGDASPEFRAVVDQLYGLARFGMKLGLDRMERLLADLGNPERAYRSVHVAGSNGKGSTCAFLAAILARHGLKVGLYSSPHLISLVERVQIFEGTEGRSVSEARMVSAVRAVEAVRPGLKGLTFFEVMTAAGLFTLKEEGVQLAVVEAGLGAKLDATRVVPAELAVLTDLSLEHTNILGDTIEAIAADEGQVARPGRPLVAADGPAPAMRVIDDIVAAGDCALHRIGGDLCAHPLSPGVFDLSLGPRSLGAVRLSLRGPHQGRNAVLAAMAATLVAPEVKDETLRQGLGEARWPGRLEVFEGQGGRVLLDGAQNPHAARALAGALRVEPDLFGPRHFVFGALEDKDVGEMLATLMPLASSVSFTRPATPRARDPEALVGLLASAGSQVPMAAHSSIPAAFSAAWARAQADSGWVVVCGSLYLVAEVRAALVGRAGPESGFTNLRGFSTR